MSFKIEKAAVLGSGVMGSQIAAHIANAGIPVMLYDLNQEIVEKGMDFCKKLKPAPFFNPKLADQITLCNYDDHLDQLKDCDWVVEVIAEKLEWKKELYDRIIPELSDTAIVSTNTSGINLSDMIEGLPESFTSRFCLTHFFNPPRYLHLVEVAGSEFTKPEVIADLSKFLTNELGKGVVHAKDTPNFIANRIGVFGMMTVLDVARQLQLSVEDVDALTGPLIGRAKSATFRTADIVGLDTMAYVANTAYEKCTEDESRDIFKIPDYLQKMVDNEWLGQKSGQGFYKKIDKGVIHSLDLETLEYTPQNKKRFKGIGFAREKDKLGDKLIALLKAKDKAGQFSWEVFSKTMIYAAFRLGEIADDIVSIDNALKWGFGWEMGPFETWDMLGFDETANRMTDDRKNLPSWVKDMQNDGVGSFYKIMNGKRHFYDPFSKEYKPIPDSEKTLNFKMVRDKNSVIRNGWSASLLDLGDGVAGIELHSILKSDMNPIDGSLIEMIYFARHWVEQNGYKGLVISSDGPNFSAGANLKLIQTAIEKRKFDEIERLVKSMQDVLQSLRFAPYPVVAAPYQFTFGGGYELIGACDKIVASAELYCGLVEVGVGLIPGAGGNLRVLSKNKKKMKSLVPGNMPVFTKTMETIGFAKIAFSAMHAKSLGYLTEADEIVMNRRHLLLHAKNAVLDLCDGYSPPEMETFKLPGKPGILAAKVQLKGARKAGKISDHDMFIGEKLAYVLTGGDKGGPFSAVDEQYLLDIEREMFVSLCAEEKTKARIDHFLSTGKPLRN